MNQDAESNNALNVGLVFLLGVALGATIGLLFAPKSGTETRAMLAEKALEAKEKAKEAAEKVREKAAMLRRHADGKAGATSA
jgi:gas vesicle protein